MKFKSELEVILWIYLIVLAFLFGTLLAEKHRATERERIHVEQQVAALAC